MLLRHRGFLVTLTIAVCIIVFIPWHYVANNVSTHEILGVPIGYLWTIFFAPICLLLIGFWFIHSVEDIDRHDVDLENE